MLALSDPSPPTGAQSCMLDHLKVHTHTRQNINLRDHQAYKQMETTYLYFQRGEGFCYFAECLTLASGTISEHSIFFIKISYTQYTLALLLGRDSSSYH